MEQGFVAKRDGFRAVDGERRIKYRTDKQLSASLDLAQGLR
jgi:hypothetical protein